MLTIIIFSGDRYKYLNQILNDLSKIDSNLIKILVIDWGVKRKTKKKFYRKKKIKNIKNLKVIFDSSIDSYNERYAKYIKWPNTKYVWLISDDDRISVQNFNELLILLKNYNYSGITLTHESFFKKKNTINNKKFKVSNINIGKDLYILGFISAQIINLKKLKIIYKSQKKNLIISPYPQLFIILKIIITYNNWIKLDTSCLFNRRGNYDYLKNRIIERLIGDYRGYLLAIKKILNEKHFNFKKLYNQIFIKNILSWMLIAVKIYDKSFVYEKIKNERKILKETLLIKFILYLIYITPVKFILFLKKIYNLISR